MNTEKRFNYDYSRLRGRIREKLGSEAALAAELGKSATWLSLVFNNKAELGQVEISKTCELLDIQPIEIQPYFFTLKVKEA